MNKKSGENWKSPLGAILAVSGGAIGLGNFLRFPSQVAEYGGGAFMIAYVISFILVGLPLCWAEWTVGRFGGQSGYSSAPSIYTVIWKHPLARYVGAVCIAIVMAIFMYYIYVEAWCLGYAFNYLLGDFHFKSVQDAAGFWSDFVGVHRNGSAIGFNLQSVGVYLLLVFLINFYLIYHGISRGIEVFCKAAMPTLLLMALVVLIRVLTLSPPSAEHPENTVNNGLGFMWNPSKQHLQENKYLDWSGHRKSIQHNLDQGQPEVPPLLQENFKWIDIRTVWGREMIDVVNGQILDRTTERTAFINQYGGNLPPIPQAFLEKKSPALRLDHRSAWQQLIHPKVWLAAASQVLFSLSVGFGAILTYASYMKKDDDVVLSCLTAVSANEFCEVALGGLIAIPAGFAFLGASGISGQGTFALGFHVLPMVFSAMPLGSFFGFLFFFLLFLAAVTSTLSLLQPSIAFLEESLHVKRNLSVGVLAAVSFLGCLFVVYFSEDAKALDSLDFWVSSFMIFTVAMISSFIFSWGFGVDRIESEVRKGALISIPRFFFFCMRYVTPFLLSGIFLLWILLDVLGVGGGELNYHVVDLLGDSKRPPSAVAWMSVSLVITLIGLLSFMVAKTDHFDALHRKSRKGDDV